MKQKIFTLLIAFLTMVGNAVWAESKSHNMSSGTLTITTAGEDYTVTGTADDNNEYHISVSLPNADDVVDITLNGVSIDQNGKSNSALEIVKGTVRLHLAEGTENSMVSGHAHAGIYVSTDATLIIDGKGELTAACKVTSGSENAYGAGIGGGQDNDFGTIWIKEGTIDAYSMQDGDNAGHAHAAGIGGGGNESSDTPSQHGTIIITGGTVTAKCQDDNGVTTPGTENQKALGAAIGGGWKGTCDAIAILGGTVTAQNIAGNQRGHNFGVGYEYEGSDHPEIIIGKWDESTETTVKGDDGYKYVYDKTNFLDARNETVESEGSVSLPAGTQMYMTAESWSGTLNAYQVTLVPTQTQIDGGDGEEGHTITVYESDGSSTVSTERDKVIERFGNYYYGPKMEVEIPGNIHCDKHHHFMGWLKENGSQIEVATAAKAGGKVSVPSETGEGSTEEDYVTVKVKTAETAPTNIQATKYQAVWVDNEMPITVISGTTWNPSSSEGDDFSPKVSVTPETAADLLTFTLNAGDAGSAQLKDVKFSDTKGKKNYLSGSPKLQDTDGDYKKLDNITATVSVPAQDVTRDAGSGAKSVTVKFDPFEITKQVTITKAEITVTPPTYNGQSHLNEASEENYTVKVWGKASDEAEAGLLRPGLYYTLKSYKYKKAGSEEEAQEQTDNLTITDAGEYTEFVIENAANSKFAESPEGLTKVTNAVETRETGTVETVSYKITADGKNTLTVQPKQVSIQAKDLEWTIGDNSNKPNFESPKTTDWTIPDVLETDKKNVTISGTISGTVSSEDWETKAGEYSVSYSGMSLSGDKAHNYTLGEGASAKATLTVKKEGGDGDGEDLKPGDPDDEDTDIKIDGGWEWDATAQGYTRVYDGDSHPLNAANTVYYRWNNGGTDEWKAVPAEKLTVTYKKNDQNYTGSIEDAATYIASISITEDDNLGMSGKVGDITLTIEARPMNIDFNLPESVEEEGEVAIRLEDVKFEEQSDDRGLLASEAGKQAVEGSFLYEAVDGDRCKVSLKGFKLTSKDEENFKLANYDMYIYDATQQKYVKYDPNDEDGSNTVIVDPDKDDDDNPNLPDGGDVTIDDNTGGGITYDYNDLHLIKSEGASLSSRHNKMRVKDGGSFTITMTLGEGYEDCQPTVFVKRGRYGNWEVLDIDEVSGYYQIRNVYSDIWVKVCGDGIWAVANEDIEAQEARAYTLDNKIVVLTPQPEEVYVISMTGAVVANEQVNWQREFANLPAGVYIVRIGEETFKLNVR